MKRNPFLKILSVAVFFTLTSCLGLSIDIETQRSGSGKINMEYRISGGIENIGRLDGNERWSILAVGRADWERTAARIDGMKLASFSSRERGDETLTSVTLEYESAEVLLAFLDPNGVSTRFPGCKLAFLLIDPVSEYLDRDLAALMMQAFDGYKFSMSFSGDASSSISFFDGTLKEIPPPPGCEIVSSGRKVSFNIDMSRLLSMTNGFGICIR